MYKDNFDLFIESLMQDLTYYINGYWIRFFWALIIIITWIIISILVYRFVLFIFAKFKILNLLEKFEIEMYEEKEEEKQKTKRVSSKSLLNEPVKTIKKPSIFKKKLKIDQVVSKSISYYVFLLFFRWSIIVLGITEVEQFLKSLLNYLPNLFIWVIISYFGVRFANFIYDLVYHTLAITKQKTAKIIASWAKIMILFFTLMVFLNYTKLVDGFIINVIFIWFVSMLTIAWWLAFWLWWKDVAAEILESFRK